jgi:acyl carrier protein phosphodiesterase
MNYLAHIALSGENEFVKIGNFMADGVKGRKYKFYSKNIQIGIKLHRQIDWFTDNNEVVKQSKKRLNNQYRHYKGVIIDIYYDHFLAKNWNKYYTNPLSDFTHKFYKSLENNFEILPEKVQHLTSYMIKYDWLTGYSERAGIEKVLVGMDNRTEGKSKMNLAIKDLTEHYNDFDQDFTIFFKKLRNFSAQKLLELNKEFE